MASPEVSARRSFAIYLETAGPGERAEHVKRLLGPAAVQAAHDRWRTRLTGLGTAAEDVIALLGPPDEHDESTLRYALPTRRGYLYTFDFAPHGRGLCWSGFRRVDGVAAPRGDVSDPMQLCRNLAKIGATGEEVHSWLGVPAETYGWWPVETWEYSDGLVLQFRHGIVEESKGSWSEKRT